MWCRNFWKINQVSECNPGNLEAQAGFMAIDLRLRCTQVRSAGRDDSVTGLCSSPPPPRDSAVCFPNMPPVVETGKSGGREVKRLPELS